MKGDLMKVEKLEIDKLSIEKQVKQDVFVFYIRGHIDFLRSQKVKSYFMAQIDDNNIRKIALNLEKLTYVDSSGLGALLAILQKVNNKQGKMRICCVQRPVYDIMNLTKLIHLFQVDSTEETSVKTLNATVK